MAIYTTGVSNSAGCVGSIYGLIL